MKRLVLLVSCLLLTSACAQRPQSAPSPELILNPVDPEESLQIDEQFLKKSRRVGVHTGRRAQKSALLAPNKPKI